jgi:uncharacterized repeat protein (TIGR03803 family)
VLYSFEYYGTAGKDGNHSRAGLIDVGGPLFGTTENGGKYNKGCFCRVGGTVFSVTLGGREKVLHSFGHGTDVATPVASLIEVKGTLYGTTECGGANDSSYCSDTGANGCGTVFSITPSGKETVLHSFGSGTDGSDPAAALTDVNGPYMGRPHSVAALLTVSSI